MSLETLEEVTGYTFDQKRFFMQREEAALWKIENILSGCCNYEVDLSLHTLKKHRDQLIELLQILEDECTLK